MNCTVYSGFFGQWRSLPGQRMALSVMLLFGLALQSFDLHAELLFRSMVPVNGQPGWSPIKRYSNPADINYPRASANSVDEVRVFISGEITAADLASTQVMMGLLRSGKQKVAGNTVWLSSDGGDIDTGMDMGRLFRQAGLFTLVGRDDQCLSACVFAFMGGERRSVAGRLGIHRPFFPSTQDSPDRRAKFRHLQQVLRNYVEEMDFPSSLYEAIMLAPPESMQFVVAADLRRFYLEGISPSSEDIADAAGARRLNVSMAQYLGRKAKTPDCVFPAGRCDGTVQETTASGAAAFEGEGQSRRTAATTLRSLERSSSPAQGAEASRSTVRYLPGS